MNWALLALLGGVVGIDATSFPQAMISRPLIAATLAGWLFGNPAAGLMLGAVLEILTLVILPFGAARYPESGTAAAAAGAAYAQAATAAFDPNLLLLTVVFWLAWEQLAGITVIWLRGYNGRLIAGLPLHPAPAALVTRRQLLAITLDFVRASAVVMAGAGGCLALLNVFGNTTALSPAWGSRILMVALMAMLGAALPLFGGLRARPYAYTLGILCGSLLLLL